MYVNYRKYIVSSQWKAFRFRKLASVNHICERCKKRKAREVHHRHYITLGHEELADTEALCRPCHASSTKKVRLKKQGSSLIWPF